MQFLRLALNEGGDGTHNLYRMHGDRIVGEPVTSRDLRTILEAALDALSKPNKGYSVANVNVSDPSHQFIASGRMELAVGNFRTRVHGFLINGGTVSPALPQSSSTPAAPATTSGGRSRSTPTAPFKSVPVAPSRAGTARSTVTARPAARPRRTRT